MCQEIQKGLKIFWKKGTFKDNNQMIKNNNTEKNFKNPYKRHRKFSSNKIIIKN